MKEQIKLRFGKHKGTMLKDVPIDYLKWCVDNNILKGIALSYAKQRLDYPKDKYQVIVKDSVGTDGTYIVEAYSKKEAMWACQKQYKIQNTQSHYGTEYSITKL